MIRKTRVVKLVVGIPVSGNRCAFITTRCELHSSLVETLSHENSFSRARHPILQTLNLHNKTEVLERNNDRTQVRKPTRLLAYFDDLHHRVAVVDQRNAD